MNDYIKEIVGLRAIVEKLESENEYLKGLLTEPSEAYPADFKLSPKESKILTQLRAAKGLCTKAQLLKAIDIDESCQTKIVEVYIFWLRKKLMPFGIRIRNEWGIGYVIDEDGRKKLNKAITDGEALPTRYALEKGWHVTY